MTRRFFTAKPLTQAAPGGSLDMGVRLSPYVAPAEPVEPAAQVICPECPECPTVCVDDSYAPGFSYDGGFVQHIVFDWATMGTLSMYTFSAVVKGRFCIPIEDIQWLATSNGSINFWFFDPFDLTGPHLSVSGVGLNSQPVVLTLTPMVNGVPISGSPYTITVPTDPMSGF